MLPRFRIASLGGIVLALMTAGACLAADPPSAPDTITIQIGSAAPVTITAEEVAQLPAIQVPVAFGTEHGPRQAVFEGPLLWALLDHAHVVDPSKPGEQVRQIVSLTGRDGYTAVLGLGEISPEFEGKQVILAERMDGKPLGPDHLRVVVPGDKRGGRSVRDIVRLTVAPLVAVQH